MRGNWDCRMRSKRFRSLRCKPVALFKLIVLILFFWVVLRLIATLFVRLTTPSVSRIVGPSPANASHIYRQRSASWAKPGKSSLPQQLGITRIIHQTWKSYDEIPETFRTWIESWIRLNPEWEYWFWNDDDIRTFIASTYPNHLRLYESYPAQGYRVDFFRYLVLYEFGGLYIDLDMECLRPIEEYFSSHRTDPPTDCMLSQEPIEHAMFLAPHGVPLVSNALMACRSKHPFFAHVISGLDWYATSRIGTGWNDVLRATGPYMLTLSYREYSFGPGWIRWLLGLGSPTNGRQAPVDLADADDFHPSPDDSMVDFMRQTCAASLPSSGWLSLSWFFRSSSSSSAVDVSVICDRLSAYDFGRRRSTTAYSTHHWTHSWVGRRNDPWGLLNEQLKRFSIEELFDDRLRVRAATTISPSLDFN